MAVRLKYAGVDPATIDVHEDIASSLDDAVRQDARAPLRPPHLHRPSRAEDDPGRPRPREGVLGMNWRRETKPSSGTTSRTARTTPTSASGASLRRAAGGPVLEVGCGTGRVTLDLARDAAITSWASTSSRRSSRRCASAPRALVLEAACRGRRCARRSTSRASSHWSSSRCRRSSFWPTADERHRGARSACGATLAPRGLIALAIVEGDLGLPGTAGFDLASRSPTWRRSTAGSTRACR